MFEDATEDTNVGEEQDSKLLKMEYAFPEGQHGIFANNLVVQHDGTAFYLSFFQVFPPVLLGSPNDRRAKLDSMDTVTANCVARIVVPASEMQAFADALTENLRKRDSGPRSGSPQTD